MGHERDRGRQCYMIQGQVYAQTYNSVITGIMPNQGVINYILSRPTVGKVMRQEQWAKTRISILANLLDELHNVNPLAKVYKTMSNYMAKVAGVNRGVAHHPTGTEVAAIYTTVDDINGADLVLRSVKNGRLPGTHLRMRFCFR